MNNAITYWLVLALLCLVFSPPFVAAQGEPHVRQVQEALKAAGFDPGIIDGILGHQTKAALRKYQSVHGLQSTGTLDATTQASLGLGKLQRGQAEGVTKVPSTPTRLSSTPWRVVMSKSEGIEEVPPAPNVPRVKVEKVEEKKIVCPNSSEVNVIAYIIEFGKSVVHVTHNGNTVLWGRIKGTGFKVEESGHLKIIQMIEEIWIDDDKDGVPDLYEVSGHSTDDGNNIVKYINTLCS
jgi:hypothetical protein